MSGGACRPQRAILSTLAGTPATPSASAGGSPKYGRLLNFIEVGELCTLFANLFIASLRQLDCVMEERHCFSVPALHGDYLGKIACSCDKLRWLQRAHGFSLRHNIPRDLFCLFPTSEPEKQVGDTGASE